MPVIETIPHNFDLNITIDNVYIDSWSNINIKAEVNKARVVSLTLLGREAIEFSRLGGLLEIRTGEGFDIEVPLHFKGIIKQEDWDDIYQDISYQMIYLAVMSIYYLKM